MKLLVLKGAVAQMGERIPRTDEAAGSTPVCSTIILESRWNRSGGFSSDRDLHFPEMPARFQAERHFPADSSLPQDLLCLYSRRKLNFLLDGLKIYN